MRSVFTSSGLIKHSLCESYYLQSQLVTVCHISNSPPLSNLKCLQPSVLVIFMNLFSILKRSGLLDSDWSIVVFCSKYF